VFPPALEKQLISALKGDGARYKAFVAATQDFNKGSLPPRAYYNRILETFGESELLGAAYSAYEAKERSFLNKVVFLVFFPDAPF
jgi:hypothetical protein